MKKVYFKHHRQPLSDVMAVCDEELIGKVISNGEVKITISENFYRGKLMDIEEVLPFLERSTNFNLIGRDIIDAVIKHGIIKKDGIILIDEVPYAIKISI